jgi:hypothetical protein
MILRGGDRCTCREVWSSAPFFTKNPTWDGHEPKQSLDGELTGTTCDMPRYLRQYTNPFSSCILQPTAPQIYSWKIEAVSSYRSWQQRYQETWRHCPGDFNFVRVRKLCENWWYAFLQTVTLFQNFKFSLDFFVSYYKFILPSREYMDIEIQTYNFLHKLYIPWTVHRDTHTWERPTRCTIFLNNLFHLIYPSHISNT